MKNLVEFNKCFPDSKYREIGPYYSGDNHTEYQRSKAPINTSILSFEEIKNTPNRIGWIIPKEYIAIDLDNKLEAAKLYNVLQHFNVSYTFMGSKHGGHFIFKNDKNYGQGTKLATAIGLTIDTRSQEKGYIILPYNDPDRFWGTLTDKNDALPYYIRPLRGMKLCADFVDMTEGHRNDELLKHFLNLKDYASELNLEEKVESIKILNKLILKDPLDDVDLMSTVLREEMVNRPSLSDTGDDISIPSASKRAARLEAIASKFTTDNKCITVNDHLYMFNGKFYEKTSDGTAYQILHAGYDKTMLSGDRNEVLKFVKLKTFVDSMELDKNWNEIVVKNGILNLSNLELYPHNSNVYNTVCVNYNWNPNVNYSPIIDSFMNQISTGDEHKKTFLYEIVGYTLLRKPVFGKMFLLYGGGGTGKSTFLNLIRKLIGDIYCSYLTLSDMEKEFLPAEMFGKLVNLGDDIDAKILKDTGMLKSVITGETVTVHRKFEAPFNFNNFAKLIFTCNKLPVINDRTTGIYRRLSIVEINKKIEKFDPFFLFKITDEDMEYLLYNGVKALRDALERNSLSEDDGMTARLQAFRLEQSSVMQFVEDSNILSNVNFAPTQTVYDLYAEYCKRNGYKLFTKSNFLSEFCDEYGFEIKNTTRGGEGQCRRFVKKKS